ncbi:hypothetical protein CRT60_09495 [Azospirillum palustre]|uniref:Uncharacterized protein n=1 Tax=Azospirillum palustre TaxID=2044885 RepID=A0A2B8BK82_9PROT|nr:hypothetical protein CRT60_09495 [Azospirillum palustre]
MRRAMGAQWVAFLTLLQCSMNRRCRTGHNGGYPEGQVARRSIAPAGPRVFQRFSRRGQARGRMRRPIPPTPGGTRRSAPERFLSRAGCRCHTFPTILEGAAQRQMMPGTGRRIVMHRIGPRAPDRPNSQSRLAANCSVHEFLCYNGYCKRYRVPMSFGRRLRHAIPSGIRHRQRDQVDPRP